MTRSSFLNRLFGQPPVEKAASTTYLALVAQARSPRFYRDWQVPDTLDGRFDMIVLHVALMIRRIKKGPGAAPDADRDGFNQALFDYMFNDMDRSLREIGVTDLGVGKRVKQMAAAFYGRAEAYQSALDAGDGAAVEEALARNVYRKGEADPQSVAALARYCETLAQALEDQPLAELLKGVVTFPVAEG